MRKALIALLLLTACEGEPPAQDVDVQVIRRPLRAQDSIVTVKFSIKYTPDYDNALMSGYYTGLPISSGGTGIRYTQFPSGLGGFACPNIWVYVCSDAACTASGATSIPMIGAYVTALTHGSWRDPYYSDPIQVLDYCSYKAEHIVINGDISPHSSTNPLMNHVWIASGMRCAGGNYTNIAQTQIWGSNFDIGASSWEVIKTYSPAAGLYVARGSWHARGLGCGGAGPNILSETTYNIGPITVCSGWYAGSHICGQWAETGFTW